MPVESELHDKIEKLQKAIAEGHELHEKGIIRGPEIEKAISRITSADSDLTKTMNRNDPSLK